MTRPLRPEITPLMIALFADYLNRNGAWGVLHIVLDDGNYQDADVEHCIQWALEVNDQEGWMLARILLGLSKGQRHKLGDRARAHLRWQTSYPLLDYATEVTS